MLINFRFHHNKDDLSQCWTVCHLISTDQQTWSRVCHVGVEDVCRGACQTACSLFSEDPTTLMKNQQLQYNLIDNIVTVQNFYNNEEEESVFILISRDREGAWYELIQTQETVMEMFPRMMETFLIKVCIWTETFPFFNG